MVGPHRCLPLLFLMTRIWTSVGELIPYHHHHVFPLAPEYLTIPKYAKNDAPNWPPSHGHSYIDLSALEAHSDCKRFLNGDSGSKCPTSKLDILMFEEPSGEPWTDFWVDGQFCCTQEVIDSGGCYDYGTLIVPPNLPTVFTRKLSIEPGALVSFAETDSINHHLISKTGVYVVLFAVCDGTSPPVVLEGNIDSMDPYGYLPADKFGNLPFYGALSCLYSIVGLCWLLACVCYSEEILPLQLWITTVLAFGMVETGLLFFHYINWNDTGTPAIAITILGLIFGVLKRTVSRVVVLFVALGYGIVRPSLGDDMPRGLTLGVCYGILSLVYTLDTTLPSAAQLLGDPTFDMMTLVTFMLAGVETTFYIWIITSINNLLTSLAARKQAVKYLLYRNFRSVLFATLFFVTVWMLYSSVLTAQDGNGEESNWQYLWTIDALWELTYFVLFTLIAFLWAPSRNNHRYATSIELTQLDDDEDYNVAASTAIEMVGTNNDKGDGLDAEYGGQLQEGDEIFAGKGALDTAMAIQKKA